MQSDWAAIDPDFVYLQLPKKKMMEIQGTSKFNPNNKDLYQHIMLMIAQSEGRSEVIVPRDCTSCSLHWTKISDACRDVYTDLMIKSM